MDSTDAMPQPAPSANEASVHVVPRTGTDGLGHVVRIQGAKNRGFDAICGSLSAEILAQIRQTSRFRRKPRRWVRALDQIRVVNRLPGLVVWFAEERQIPEVRGVIVDPFEPVALSDAHALETLLEGQAVLGSAGMDSLLLFERGDEKWAWLGLVFVACMTVLLLKVAGIGGVLRVLGEVGSALVLLALVALLSRQWFIIAQGVLCRPRVLWRGRSLERFTRPDSTLLITPRYPLAFLIALRDPFWWANVCRADRVRSSRVLGDRECLALLAAWQSPAPPPELSQLGDYA